MATQLLMPQMGYDIQIQKIKMSSLSYLTVYPINIYKWILMGTVTCRGPCWAGEGCVCSHLAAVARLRAYGQADARGRPAPLRAPLQTRTYVRF